MIILSNSYNYFFQSKTLEIYVNRFLNPFQANVPFLYPLENVRKPWVSDVFRGYRKGTLAWNGLNLPYSSGITKHLPKLNFMQSRLFSFRVLQNIFWQMSGPWFSDSIREKYHVLRKICSDLMKKDVSGGSSFANTCSKLTVEILEQCSVFIVNMEQVFF